MWLIHRKFFTFIVSCLLSSYSINAFSSKESEENTFLPDSLSENEEDFSIEDAPKPSIVLDEILMQSAASPNAEKENFPEGVRKIRKIKKKIEFSKRLENESSRVLLLKSAYFHDFVGYILVACIFTASASFYLVSAAKDIVVHIKRVVGFKKRPSIVLDLDETLIQSAIKSNEEKDSFLEKIRGLEREEIEIRKMGFYRWEKIENELWSVFVFRRPYLEDFLEYIFTHFDVYIFTAATLTYAESVVKHILDPEGHIKGIIAREHYFKGKKSAAKDLELMKNIFGIDLSNTLFFDDCEKNIKQFENAVIVPQFKPLRVDCRDDCFLNEALNLLKNYEGNFHLESIVKEFLGLKQKQTARQSKVASPWRENAAD